jgi:hypothetical protein
VGEPVGGRREMAQGEYAVNTVYTCMEMKKKLYVETIPGNGEGKMKENGGEGEFKYNVFDIL